MNHDHPAIDCRHLTHRYGGFTAVDDLTLQVAVGETLGLLGPNGAGKTTVVKLLTTLAPIQSGEVRIFGLDAHRDTMDIRYNLGYVPQQVSSETLASIGLLDEPTVGLDPIARDGVWSHVQRMQLEFDMTVLLTTHYMEEADVLTSGEVPAVVVE